MVRVRRQLAGSIEGGFVLIPVASLMAAWTRLGAADFRAWLAMREMIARRCQAGKDRSPRFTTAELAGLLGVAERNARASLRRLVALGLVEWSTEAIVFPELLPGAGRLVEDCIGGGRGEVAVPRRILRFLAHGARPALVATALGVLLRCLARRRSGWDARGRLKASWVAQSFGVDVRSVKSARKELVALGWIRPEEADQWAMNRWGKPYRIDLAWDRDRQLGRRSPPPPPTEGPQSPPPCLHQEPLREADQHQEPGPAGPAGVRLEGSEKEIRQKPAPAGPNPAVIKPGADLPAPRLADVRVEDLVDTGRLLELLDQAVAGKLLGASEADRLRFVAAAEHARAVGRGNPPGLFAYLVRGACWRYLTQEDEGRANARIKAYLRGPAPPPVAGAASRRPALSEDARMVHEFRRAMASAGYRGDPFPQVRRHIPSWTRGRWDAASAELGLA